MPWTVALDVVMAFLLVASIATTIVLNRRLASLRGDRAELEKLAEHFRRATERADEGVSGLKISAQTLQERIDAARSVADDLAFLIDRGGGLADRLEVDVRAARRPQTHPQAAPATSSATTASSVAADTGARPKARGAAGEPRSAAERHLLAALRARG